MTDNEKERSTEKVSDNFEKDKILASRYSDYFNHYIKSSKKLSMAIVNEEKAISENDSIGISEKEVYKFSNTQKLRKEQDELSDYNEEEISKAYNSLSDTSKYIVRQAIYNLTGKNVDKTPFNVIFNQLLKENNLTTSKLARYIVSDIECFHNTINYSIKNKDTKKEGEGKKYEKVRSLLNSFSGDTNTVKQVEKNAYIFSGLCKYFSVDMNLLLTGHGKRYYIDEAEVCEQLEKNNIDIENFYIKIFDSLYECKQCEYNKQNNKEFDKCDTKTKKAQQESIILNIKEIANKINRRIGINGFNSLKEEIYDIKEDNKFAFKNCFCSLKQNEKKMVWNLVYDLLIVDNDSNVNS